MKRLRTAFPTIASIILISLALDWITIALDSSFLADFLERELITILIALMAINITTISVIIAKLQEMAQRGVLDHSNVIDEMQFSIVEQVGLVILGVLLLIMRSSDLVTNLGDWVEATIRVGLITVLGYAIWSLYNTGRGIFSIAKIENKRLLQEHDNKSGSHHKTGKHNEQH